MKKIKVDKKSWSKQEWSAIAMLLTGSVMSFVNLYQQPVGEISDGVLWYTGQCFLYAGGIFGIGAWARREIHDAVTNIKEDDGEYV